LITCNIFFSFHKAIESLPIELTIKFQADFTSILSDLAQNDINSLPLLILRPLFQRSSLHARYIGAALLGVSVWRLAIIVLRSPQYAQVHLLDIFDFKRAPWLRQILYNFCLRTNTKLLRGTNSNITDLVVIR